MAVGVLVEMPGLTQVDFERVTEKLFGHYPMRPTDAPEGLILHSAGPSEGGWYVYDIWKSKEDFERFGDEQIGPAVRKVMGRDDPQQEVQFFEIDNLVPVLLDGASRPVH